MAFSATEFSLVGYGAGQKLWLYNTTDSSATVYADGYFPGTNTIPLLKAKDFILAACSTSAEIGAVLPVILPLYVKRVSATSSTTVRPVT